MKLSVTPTLILAALLASYPIAPAFAGGGGFNPLGATLPEQIVQEGTLINQLTQTITQTSQQLQMLMNQIKNLQSLPTQLWPNIGSQLSQLINIAGQAQGLTYASMNTASQVQMQYGNTSTLLPNYTQKLQQWTTNLNSQVATILQQYGLEANNFGSEQSALQAVQTASQSAVGRMQVLQAGNQISGMMVNELQLLRGDILSGNQVMMNALANKANQEQQDRNTGDAWIKSNSTYQTSY
ncbi:MAG: P-type conjugative transfer protein TrbJ [Thiobacillaceae bacterium]